MQHIAPQRGDFERQHAVHLDLAGEVPCEVAQVLLQVQVPYNSL